MRILLVFVASSSMVAVAGCSSDTSTEPHGTEGSVVVGVTSELRAGTDVKLLHVVQRAAGKVVADEDVGAGLKFPSEFRFDNLPDRTPVDIELSAFASGNGEPALLT